MGKVVCYVLSLLLQYKYLHWSMCSVHVMLTSALFQGCHYLRMRQVKFQGCISVPLFAHASREVKSEHFLS